MRDERLFIDAEADELRDHMPLCFIQFTGDNIYEIYQELQRTIPGYTAVQIHDSANIRRISDGEYVARLFPRDWLFITTNQLKGMTNAEYIEAHTPKLLEAQ